MVKFLIKWILDNYGASFAKTIIAAARNVIKEHKEMTQKNNEKDQTDQNEDSLNNKRLQGDHKNETRMNQDNLFGQNIYQEANQDNNSDDQVQDIRSRLFNKPIKRKMNLEEAMTMLAVKTSDPDEVTAQFKKLMSLNDPAQGGSFYLQCKLMAAREVLNNSIKKDSKLL